MFDPQTIKPHMPVVGDNDIECAIVDRVEGQCLKLTRDESGQHHYIPLDWITSVDDKVHLDRSGNEVTQSWSTQPL